MGRPKLARLGARLTVLETRRMPVAEHPPEFIRMRGRKLQARNMRIKLRDLWTCQHCGRTTDELEIDHITPVAQGGTEHDHNMQSLCVQCHLAKTAIDNAETARRRS